MRQRRLSVILMVVTVSMAFTGCGQLSAVKSKKLYKDKITIGAAVWPGYLCLAVAEEKGYFKEAGLTVEIKWYVALKDV